MFQYDNLLQFYINLYKKLHWKEITYEIMNEVVTGSILLWYISKGNESYGYDTEIILLSSKWMIPSEPILKNGWPIWSNVEVHKGLSIIMILFCINFEVLWSAKNIIWPLCHLHKVIHRKWLWRTVYRNCATIKTPHTWNCLFNSFCQKWH